LKTDSPGHVVDHDGDMDSTEHSQNSYEAVPHIKASLRTLVEACKAHEVVSYQHQDDFVESLFYPVRAFVSLVTDIEDNIKLTKE
jgi:hypothetical protein